MQERKTELISLRVTPAFKRGLKRASEGEKRSQANFLEKLVLDYCERHKISVADAAARKAPSTVAKRATKAPKKAH